jgi:acetyl esterase/lipase
LHVSDELQQAIRKRAIPSTGLRIVPRSADEWRKKISINVELPEAVRARNDTLTRQFPVKLSAQKMVGVPVHVVMPMAADAGKHGQVVLAVHGGAYVSGAGEAGIDEAILLAY